MVPLAKFDISSKNAPPPGLTPFCTESWQKFPPIFFSISLAPTNIVVRVHTKNYGKTRKTKGIYRKTRKPLRRRKVRHWDGLFFYRYNGLRGAQLFDQK